MDRRDVLASLLSLLAASALLVGVVTRPSPTIQGEPRLGLVWETWSVLKVSAVDASSLGPDEAIEGAIREMLARSGVEESAFQQALDSLHRAPPRDVPDGLERVWAAWEVLRELRPAVSAEDLARAASQGMVAALGDPFSQYLSAEEFHAAERFFEGQYQGIGAYIGQTDAGETVVLEPLSDTPAEAAGLQAQDVILAVDGTSTKGLTAEEVVKMVRGPAGTSVVLLVSRAGVERPFEVPVSRTLVAEPSVGRASLSGDVSYIRIWRFAQTTGQEFHQRLQESLETGARGILLDLRFNPGGTIEDAVDVAGQFLGEKLILYEVDSTGKRQDWKARGGGPPAALTISLVVLVDQNTASAAEVVAGALQDYGRARLFGTTTYGKGAIQIFKELRDGSAIYLTVGRWYTPSGHPTQGQGVVPDERVTNVLLQNGVLVDRQLQVAYLSLLSLL
ncbi:MAG: PDZ domain-containing protein [Chloroflexi bacterium]|nr:PDZ domain-containing protein [Chloroflexota bacterium]